MTYATPIRVEHVVSEIPLRSAPVRLAPEVSFHAEQTSRCEAAHGSPLAQRRSSHRPDVAATVDSLIPIDYGRHVRDR